MTHLDHMSGAQRAIQLAHITEILSSDPSRGSVGADLGAGRGAQCQGDQINGPDGGWVERREGEGWAGGADAEVVVGDMNALTRSDYSEEQWEAVVAVHRANGWSEPTAGCLDVLTASGFLDAASVVNGVKEHAGRRLSYTTPAMHPRVRVDYCFVRGSCIKVEDVKVLGHGEEIGSSGSWAHLSDHLPLVVDLTVELVANLTA